MPSLARIGSYAQGRWTQDEVFPSMKDVGPLPEEKMLVHYRSEMVALSPHGHQLLCPVIAPSLSTCKAVAPILTCTHPSEMLRARLKVSR